jgi:F0F1-type ATP synthase epsilon subunit
MRKPFRLKVLTPERTLLAVKGVTQVQAQLADGSPIGIYPGHAPLLAETVAAPLRYTDPSGEHALDLCAGILQVGDEGVTVFARSQISEVCETSEILEEDDGRFDRLAHELLTRLNAQPDEVLDIEQPAEGDQT